MNLDEWFEIYREITLYFNFSPEEDYKASVLMQKLGKGKLLPSEVLREIIEGKSVTVVGGAVKTAVDDEVVITAGKSIFKWIEIADRIPDIHVTDMEEPAELLVDLEKNGTLLVLHAHGDNMDRIREVVPKVKNFVGTTQNKPFDRIYNFGGFTDGDRAVIIAKRFNAKSIRLHGFDFNAEGIKGEKLKWAKKILEREGLI